MARAAAVRNILKAWLLLAALCAVLGLAGWELDGYPGALLFVFCGLLTGVAAYWYADRAVLGMVRARELLPGEAPAFHSLVERLSIRAGVVKPRLYAIPDGLPIALATGRGPASSSLAVSTGLLALPAPAELEGVVAHELAHVRTRDVLVQTIAVVAAALLVESSRVGGWLSRALLFVLGPVAAAFVHLLLSPKREFEADRLAAAYCESPHGLADALIRLEQAAELVSFRASPATEPLFTLDPFPEEGLPGLFATHPAVAERVGRLRSLDPTWKQRLRAA
jgi:heat shock protein HtpX